MKKFLIIVVTIITLIIVVDTAYFQWGFYLGEEKEVSAFITVEGKDILLDAEGDFVPFEIRGVDIGSGIPGHYTTEYAIDKDTYLRWFAMIQEMGANTIRIYSILGTDFYDAVYEYNTNNPNPLYVIHGVLNDGYAMNSRLDAYADEVYGKLTSNCKATVDVIHGKRRISDMEFEETGLATYRKDISPWVLGYLVGTDWSEDLIAYTNEKYASRNGFEGKYLEASEHASAFESMLAMVGDALITYETEKYGTQRLIAFTNYPATDALPEEKTVLEKNGKITQINIENISGTEKFLSGHIAAYEVYPYALDYRTGYEEWKEEFTSEEYLLEDGSVNMYKAYLTLLNRFHTVPVLISGYGVSSSRGKSSVDTGDGRTQGYLSEQEQGEVIVACYNDILEAGCAGSLISTWQDEWHRTAWNTIAFVDTESSIFWSDVQTSEQMSGLLTFEPGKDECICCLDGCVGEWTEEDLVQDKGNIRLYAKYDERYIYLRIHKEQLDICSDCFYIPVDVTPKSGSNYAVNQKSKFEREADFLIVLDGTENSRVLVQEYYCAFDIVHGEDYGQGNSFINVPEKNSPVFKELYLALGEKLENAEGDQISLEKYETGKLTYGNGNADSQTYLSYADFYSGEEDVELRIPWQMLNFSDPSRMYIHDDYYENYGIESMKIDGIWLGIGTEKEKEQRVPMEKLELRGWGEQLSYHERLKKSYYVIQREWQKDRK